MELAGYTTNTTTTTTTTAFSAVTSLDSDPEALEEEEEEVIRTTDGDWTPTAEDVQLSAAMVGVGARFLDTVPSLLSSPTSERDDRGACRIPRSSRFFKSRRGAGCIRESRVLEPIF